MHRWTFFLRLTHLLSVPMLLACAGLGGKKLTLNTAVMGEDSTLIASRGTGNGPWPRVLTDTRNPGPSLPFTHEGDEFTAISYTRVRVTEEGLLVCGTLRSRPGWKEHLGCYLLQPSGDIQTIWMERYEDKSRKTSRRLLPTSQGNLLRHTQRRDGPKQTHTWQIWRGRSWEKFPEANGYIDLDESPGVWWGIKPLPSYKKQAAGWTKKDKRPVPTLPISRSDPHLMAASGHDEALIVQYDWAKLWKPDGTKDLLPPGKTPDGSKEGFMRATWGPPGPNARDIVVWSSREKGEVKTGFGASNAFFHPFRRKPDGSFEQAASFTSSVWEPIWAPRWVEAFLLAP